MVWAKARAGDTSPGFFPILLAEDGTRRRGLTTLLIIYIVYR